MSRGYDKLKERIGRVEKILGIRHRDPTDPAPKCTCLHLPSGKFQNLWYDPHCPEHGHTKWKKLIKDGINFKPECTCLKTGEQPLECPVHPRDRFGMGIVSDPEPACTLGFRRCGTKASEKWYKIFTEWRDKNLKDPEIPLYARVAKALEYEVWFNDSADLRERGWVYNPGTLNEGERFSFVPRYDLDEKLAMQAFWGYITQNGYHAQINYGFGGGNSIVIVDPRPVGECKPNLYHKIEKPTITAEDYCLAIDEHASNK